MENWHLDIVLVVGERPEQARALAERLGLHGVEAIPCVRDLALVRRSLTAHDISLVTVDVDRSQASARFFELLKESVTAPLVALGVRNDPDQVIWHLDRGAADYIPRATPHQVVAAKIMSLLRMVKGGMPSIRVGDLTIDIDGHVVSLAGVNISLTPIEFRLLGVLAENMGKACSRRMLLKAVWGDDFEDCSHYLRVYVRSLRQKIEPNSGSPRMIVTVWGYGYGLVAPARETKHRSARPVTRALSG
jgi:two-component system KDP operon response regulator KdpE